MVLEGPPRILVLPQSLSPEARICTLAHPRTKTPSRYLFDPTRGVYEFTRVATPKTACKSWLISSQQNVIIDESLGADDQRRSEKEASEADGGQELEERSIADGCIISTTEILVATLIDPLFLLIPAFLGQFPSIEHTKRLFLSFDDLMDNLIDTSRSYGYLMQHSHTRTYFELRMEAMCDQVDAGDEKMYRLNITKLMNVLFEKACIMIESGLPLSMEERFIRRALELPVIGIKRGESTLSEKLSSQVDGTEDESPSLDTQLSTETAASSVSVSTFETDFTVPDTKNGATRDDLERLLRFRTIITYMISSYIPVELAAALTAHMASEENSINFKPLDERLEHITKVHAEAVAARSLGNFSRKRNAYEDDDAAEARAEKKRKKEEEEKKKKLETRGLKNLKKIDTKGMKKMSDFFNKGISTNKK